MSHGQEFGALWDEFNTVVYMTSRELGEWLRTRAAGHDSETLPDQAGPAIGRKVLAVLGKRKTDVGPQEIDTMREVVDVVRAQRNPELDRVAGDPKWRYRLMDVGHDPLKPG